MMQTHEHCVDYNLRSKFISRKLLIKRGIVAYFTTFTTLERLRVLLMPLTSTLSISEHDQVRIDKASSSRTVLPHNATASTTTCSSSLSSASDSDTFYSSSSESEDEYMSMPREYHKHLQSFPLFEAKFCLITSAQRLGGPHKGVVKAYTPQQAASSEVMALA